MSESIVITAEPMEIDLQMELLRKAKMELEATIWDLTTGHPDTAHAHAVFATYFSMHSILLDKMFMEQPMDRDELLEQFYWREVRYGVFPFSVFLQIHDLLTFDCRASVNSIPVFSYEQTLELLQLALFLSCHAQARV